MPYLKKENKTGKRKKLIVNAEKNFEIFLKAKLSIPLHPKKIDFNKCLRQIGAEGYRYLQNLFMTSYNSHLNEDLADNTKT